MKRAWNAFTLISLVWSVWIIFKLLWDWGVEFANRKPKTRHHN